MIFFYPHTKMTCKEQKSLLSPHCHYLFFIFYNANESQKIYECNGIFKKFNTAKIEGSGERL